VKRSGSPAIRNESPGSAAATSKDSGMSTSGMLARLFVSAVAVAALVMSILAYVDASDAADAAADARKVADKAAKAAASKPKTVTAAPVPVVIPNHWVNHSILPGDVTRGQSSADSLFVAPFRKRVVRLTQREDLLWMAAISNADGLSWTVTRGESGEGKWDGTVDYTRLAENPTNGLLLALPYNGTVVDGMKIARLEMKDEEWKQTDVDIPELIGESPYCNFLSLQCTLDGKFYALVQLESGMHQVLSSVDNGVTWVATVEPLDTGDFGVIESPIMLVHGTTVTVAYEHFIPDEDDEPSRDVTLVRRTTNGGTTWTSVEVDAGISRHCFVSFPPQNAIVIAGGRIGPLTATSTTIVKSVDGGATWTKVAVPATAGAADTYNHTRTGSWRSMVYHPQTNTMIAWSRDVAYCSTDLLTWTPLARELRHVTTSAYEYVEHSAVHPLTGHMTVYEDDSEDFHTTARPLSLSDLRPPALYAAATSADTARRRRSGISPYDGALTGQRLVHSKEVFAQRRARIEQERAARRARHVES